MNISQEIATLIDTLATAASKIGSTPASAKLNALIVELLPPSETAALQQQITDLQISGDIKQGNLELAQSRFVQLADLLDTALDEAVSTAERYDAMKTMEGIIDAALQPVTA